MGIVNGYLACARTLEKGTYGISVTSVREFVTKLILGGTFRMAERGGPHSLSSQATLEAPAPQQDAAGGLLPASPFGCLGNNHAGK